MVEPNAFACVRMSSHGGTHLARSQSIAVAPFDVDLLLPVPFDFGAVVGLKRFAPRETDAGVVVAHVHDLFLFEPFDDLGPQTFEDLAAVGEWSAPARRCGLRAVEPDLHGPVERVRLFVVQHDRLIRWMIGRRRCRGWDARARRRAFAVFDQLRRNGSGYGFEIAGRSEIEASQQERAVAGESDSKIDVAARVDDPRQVRAIGLGLTGRRANILDSVSVDFFSKLGDCRY